MLAFTAKQAKGLTCWRHNDRHEGMQTSSFCYLMGMKNTQTRILTMPQCLFVGWEMDIKGKTEKRQRLNLCTPTWAFVSDWWSKKFRHADLTVFWGRKPTLSIHLKEFHLASPSSSSPSFSLFSLSASFHTFVFLDQFLKGQTDYHVSVLAHTFVRCRDCRLELKRGAETLWPLCCSQESVLPCCPWDFYSVTFQFLSKVFTRRSDYMTPLVPLLHFLNSFLLSTDSSPQGYTNSSNINIFKSTKVIMFFSDLNISQLPLAQQLDLTTLFPRWVFKSLLKDACESSVDETITWITFHDPNEFTLCFPAEEWITSWHVNAKRLRALAPRLNVCCDAVWMKQPQAGVVQTRGAKVWNTTESNTGIFICPAPLQPFIPFLFSPQFFFFSTRPPSSYPTN